MKVHPDDYELISKQHSNFVDGCNDDAIKLQDQAYEVGRHRGLKEGKGLRDELVEALQMASNSSGFQYMTFETREFIEGILTKARGES